MNAMEMTQYKPNLIGSSCIPQGQDSSHGDSRPDFYLEAIKMTKLCECGCGNPAPIATYTNKKKGYFKGTPVRFIYGHHNFKTGITECSGRILIYNPNHKRSNNKGYVFRSLLVAEKALRRPIPKNIIVHHFDQDKKNDKSSNLVICENAKYHGMLHTRQEAYHKCRVANWRKCSFCQKYDTIKNLYISPNNRSVYHQNCKNKYVRLAMPRWYVVNFDRNFVSCKSCKKEFFCENIKRKNKCPNCKLNNHGGLSWQR